MSTLISMLTFHLWRQFPGRINHARKETILYQQKSEKYQSADVSVKVRSLVASIKSDSLTVCFCTVCVPWYASSDCLYWEIHPVTLVAKVRSSQMASITSDSLGVRNCDRVVLAGAYYHVTIHIWQNLNLFSGRKQCKWTKICVSQMEGLS